MNVLRRHRVVRVDDSIHFTIQKPIVLHTVYPSMYKYDRKGKVKR
jgi:hypothetical protein